MTGVGWPRIVAGWPRLLGLGLLVVGFAVTSGPTGAAVGVGVALVGLFASAALTVALGQVGLLAVLASPTPLATVVAEAALVGVLAFEAYDTRGRGVSGVWLGLAVVAIAGSLAAVVGLALAELDDVWLAAAVLVGTVALVSYALHRVERLRLGLLDGPSPPGSSPRTTGDSHAHQVTGGAEPAGTDTDSPAGDSRGVDP